MSDDEKKFERDFYNDENNVNKYIPKLSSYTPKQLLRMCRIEFFNINPITKRKRKTAVLFNYYGRDAIFNKAEAEIVWEEEE